MLLATGMAGSRQERGTPTLCPRYFDTAASNSNLVRERGNNRCRDPHDVGVQRNAAARGHAHRAPRL